MKKVSIVLYAAILSVCFVSFAGADIVDNFDDFNAGLSISSPSYSIGLSSDIVVTGNLNPQASDELAIDGNGFSIDGNKYNSQFGVVSGKAVSFSGITLKNFQSVSASTDTNSLGGAVNNDGVLNISASTFTENSAKHESPGEDSKAYGGAIYNTGTVNIYNSLFSNNFAVYTGTGTAKGGAIYNEGTLNIIADGGDTEFTGNKAAGVSNAIHNDANAELNLNAGASDKIIINDAVTGAGGIVNINQTGTWDSVSNPTAPDNNKLPVSAPVAGTVMLNNSLTGNSINIYGGTLALGSFAGIRESTSTSSYIVPASRGSVGTKTSRNEFTMYDGSTFDMANGRADDIVYVATFTVVSGTASVKIDVDLAKQGSDKIDLSSDALGNGKLSFLGMRILSDFTVGVSTEIKVFTGTNTLSTDYLDNVNFVTYGSNTVYRITQGSSNTALNFLLVEYTTDTFQHAILQEGDRSLILTGNYNVPSSFNSVLSTGTFLVEGSSDGVTIHGNKVSNIFRLENTDTHLDARNLTITNAQDENGGAVYNLGIADFKKVTFKDNTATNASSDAKGGAIYNESQLNIYDTTFTGNIAVGTGAAGGAIYSKGGIVNITAENANVEFKDNKAAGTSNAIHSSSGAKLNLNALTGKTISFNDALSSDGDNNIININASNTDDSSAQPLARTNGIININADMSKFGNVNSSTGNTVNLFGGTVKLGTQAVFFKEVIFNMRGGSRIDMTNGKIDNIAVSDLKLPDTANAYLSIDADLNKAKADNMAGAKLTGGAGKLVIDKFVILDDMRNLDKKITILFSDDDALKNAIKLANAKEEILGPVFTYFATYNSGSLEFEYAYDFNPSVFIAPITMQTGGYLGQLNSYEHAFGMIDEAMRPEGAQGLWMKPYAYNEDIAMNKDLTVTNTAYGAFMGYNSKTSDLGRNINGVFSLYGSYNSSNQSYKGATIDQGGGLLGATAVFFKERFYTAFTANFGMLNEHGEGKYGKDNFMMYTKGLAAKAGYNISLDGNEKYMLQPSLDLSCSIIDIAPYKNTAGVKVETSNFAPFHIEPGLKLLADFDKGLISFVNVNMAWSIADDTNCKANNIELPVMSLDPYIQYGVGMNKIFTESFSAGAELYGRSLGRAGVGGELSVRWSFGN